MASDLSSKLKSKDSLKRGLYNENVSNIGTRILDSRMSTNIDNSISKTYQITLALSQHFDAVRVIFANNNPSLGVFSIQSKLSVLSSASDLNNSGGTWYDVYKSNQSFFMVGNAPASNQLSYAVSDWVKVSSAERTDGGIFPLIAVRATIANMASLPAYGNGTDSYTNWATKPDGHIWVARQQDGNHVSNPTTFNSTSNQNQSPLIGVQYQSRGKVYTIFGFGDSLTHGLTGNYKGEGFGQKLCSDLTDMNGITFEYSNFGWSGQLISQFAQRALYLLDNDLLRPDILFFPSGSTNDVTIIGSDAPITPTIIQNQAAKWQEVVAKCKKKNVICVIWTFLPSTSSGKNYGATDSLRVSQNASHLTLNEKGFFVVDVATPLSGATVNGQVQLASQYTVDGIHLNDAGYQVMIDQFKPLIKQLTGVE